MHGLKLPAALTNAMSSRSSGTSNTVFSEQECPVPPAAGSKDAADGKSSQSSDTATASTDDDYYKVTTLDPTNDPQRFHIGRKWLITLLICNGSLCATFASSVVRKLGHVLAIFENRSPFTECGHGAGAAAHVPHHPRSHRTQSESVRRGVL